MQQKHWIYSSGTKYILLPMRDLDWRQEYFSVKINLEDCVLRNLSGRASTLKEISAVARGGQVNSEIWAGDVLDLLFRDAASAGEWTSGEYRSGTAGGRQNISIADIISADRRHC